MASVSLFGLTPGTALASGDVLVFCDISNTTQSANGSDLKITIANFFGTVPTPVVVTSTTANQLTLAYDGSNKVTVNVSSAGAVTLNATGGSAGFTFSDLVTGSSGFSGALTGDVTGNVSGTAATVTGATQASITTCTNLTTIGTLVAGAVPVTLLTGTTLPATVVTSSLTTVGALAAGSLAAGFGNISIGASSVTAGTASFTTGAFSDAVTISKTVVGYFDGFAVRNPSGNAAAVNRIQIGNDASAGTGQILVYSSAHAQANEFAIIQATNFPLTLATNNTTRLTITGAGAANFVGDFSVATNKFTVASATGNTVVAGTLQIAGALTGVTTLDMSGALTGTANANSAYVSVLKNVNTGTAAYAELKFGNNSGNDILGIRAMGSVFTTSNGYEQDSAVIVSYRQNLNIIAENSKAIQMWAGTTKALTIASTGYLTLSAQPAFVAGDKYLVIDASGNIHKSAIGPAS